MYLHQFHDHRYMYIKTIKRGVGKVWEQMHRRGRGRQELNKDRNGKEGRVKRVKKADRAGEADKEICSGIREERTTVD